METQCGCTGREATKDALADCTDTLTNITYTLHRTFTHCSTDIECTLADCSNATSNCTDSGHASLADHLSTRGDHSNAITKKRGAEAGLPLVGREELWHELESQLQCALVLLILEGNQKLVGKDQLDVTKIQGTNTKRFSRRDLVPVKDLKRELVFSTRSLI